MSVAIQIINAALRDVFTNLGAMFKGTIVGVSVLAAIVVCIREITPIDTSEDTVLGFAIVALLYALVILSCFAVKWFRFILIDERPQWVLQWANRGAVWRVGWRMLLFAIFGMMMALVAEAVLIDDHWSNLTYFRIFGGVWWLHQGVAVFFWFITLLVVMVLAARTPPIAIERLAKGQRVSFGHAFSIIGALANLSLLMASAYRSVLLLSALIEYLFFEIGDADYDSPIWNLVETWMLIPQLVAMLLLTFVTFSIIARVHLHLHKQPDAEDVFG
jgi:hypothetical protein